VPEQKKEREKNTSKGGVCPRNPSFLELPKERKGDQAFICLLYIEEEVVEGIGQERGEVRGAYRGDERFAGRGVGEKKNERALLVSGEHRKVRRKEKTRDRRVAANEARYHNYKVLGSERLKKVGGKRKLSARISKV